MLGRVVQRVGLMGNPRKYPGHPAELYTWDANPGYRIRALNLEYLVSRGLPAKFNLSAPADIRIIT
jgi:hypothetical protein